MTQQLSLHTNDLAAALGREPSAQAVDGNGWTDLHYAAVLNAADAARELIDAGIAANVRMRSDGEQLDGDLLEVLNRFGLMFTTWKREGETPLHLAAWSNAAAAARVLVDAGAEVDSLIANGWTPLHVAARYDAAETAALLLERGALADALDSERWTPLHATVVADALKTGELLLEHGANVNARAKDRVTALHFAVLRDSKQRMDTPRFARVLLEHGAKVNARALDIDVTPTDIASTFRLPVTEALLRRYGGDVTIEEKHELVGAAHWSLGDGRGVFRPFIRRTSKRRKPRKAPPHGPKSGAKYRRPRRRARR